MFVIFYKNSLLFNIRRVFVFQSHNITLYVHLRKHFIQRNILQNYKWSFNKHKSIFRSIHIIVTISLYWLTLSPFNQYYFLSGDFLNSHWKPVFFAVKFWSSTFENTVYLTFVNLNAFALRCITYCVTRCIALRFRLNFAAC